MVKTSLRLVSDLDASFRMFLSLILCVLRAIVILPLHCSVALDGKCLQACFTLIIMSTIGIVTGVGAYFNPFLRIYISVNVTLLLM